MDLVNQVEKCNLIFSNIVLCFFYNRLFIFDRELSINDCCPSTFFYFSFSFDQISGTELEAGKGGPEAAEGSQGGIQVKKYL